MFDGRRVQLWFLKEQETLEGIVPLLSKQFSETIEGDKHTQLNFSWIPYSDDEEQERFQIKESKVNNEAVKYLTAYAAIEFMKVKKDDVPRTPRDIAVGIHSASVLFVEAGGSIKVIVSTSSTFLTKVRTKLLKKDELWGELSYKDLCIEPEFFYWLMSKKGQDLQLGVEQFNLYDLDAFDCATERNKHQYTGSGQGIDDEVPVGTMVSLSNLFTGLGLKLSNNRNIIKFSLSQTMETEISFTDCHILTDKGIDFFDSTELILKIYLQIIPGLIKAFNNQRETWPQDEIEFRRHVAARAIRELMIETGLTVDDIKKHIEQQN